MTVTFGEVLIWLIIGSMTGSFVGMMATRRKKGYGRVKNLALGMAGALFGRRVVQVFQHCGRRFLTSAKRSSQATTKS